jgi:superfamily I DNA/RNA helicase
VTDDVRRRFPHLSILASAGSGKTYQLSSRYLGLVAAGANVGSILASTFTRAAAGEIRDRILARLARAADDVDERARLAEAIRCGGLNRAQVVALVRDLVDGLHRMQIRTLDSFFGSVVRAFSIELGLPADGRMLDAAGAEEIRHEAIRRMLDDGATDRFVDLLHQLTRGTSDRAVTAVIDRTVDALYELYRESDASAWVPYPPHDELSPPALEAAIVRIERCEIVARGLARGRDGDVERARRQDWVGVLEKGIAGKIASGEHAYRSTPIEPDVAEAYGPLLAHAVAVLANRARDQTIATYELLDAFHAHAVAVKQRRRAVTFADVTAGMADAERLGALDDIGFRLDGVIAHLLLDEFQDTNVPQWRALEPIARELVGDASRPRTFFCVGDVKQSIYGWRDACPEVLDRVPRLLAGPDGAAVVEQDELTKSYRSSPVVIDVVNRVFDFIRHNRALERYPDAAALFALGFSVHDTARTELPGYAELRTGPRAEPGGDQNAVRLRAAAELTERLHRRDPERRIAVLTRSNAAVSRLLFELGPGRLDVPASGRGGGPLTDSAAVNAVLDLLTLADHPDHTIAAFNVARSPLGPLLELTDERSEPRRRAVARFVRRRLLEDGYAATIAGWTRQLAGACDERQHRRLLALVELAGAFDAEATLRPGEFVRRVEQTAVAEPTPAPVQVMTVHQSKGLEYDVVVLPELDAAVAGSVPPVVFARRNETEDVTRVCRWIKRSVRELLPEVEEMFERHLIRAVRESLAVLYVAMTRARQGLYMIIDPAPLKKDGTPSETIPATSAGVLRCALTDETPPPPDEVVYTHGDGLAMFAARPGLRGGACGPAGARRRGRPRARHGDARPAGAGRVAGGGHARRRGAAPARRAGGAASRRGVAPRGGGRVPRGPGAAGDPRPAHARRRRGPDGAPRVPVRAPGRRGGGDAPAGRHRPPRRRARRRRAVPVRAGGGLQDRRRHGGRGTGAGRDAPRPARDVPGGGGGDAGAGRGVRRHGRPLRAPRGGGHPPSGRAVPARSRSCYHPRLAARPGAPEPCPRSRLTAPPASSSRGRTSSRSPSTTTSRSRTTATTRRSRSPPTAGSASPRCGR